MSLAVTNRLTSKDVRIEFTPCSLVAAAHDVDLLFHADVTGGTFKLRINGELTGAITFSDTDATLDTNIGNAITALSLTGITFTVSTTTDTTSLTVSQSKFIRIVLEDNQLTGNATADPDYSFTLNTQGSEVVVLSGELTQFSYEESTDTVDVTAISELEATEIAVKSSMSFDATIYDANEDFTLYMLKSGENGLYTVYKEGKVVGKEVFAFTGLAESVGKELPDHEKIEISLSGMRQGAMSIPFGSIYRG